MDGLEASSAAARKGSGPRLRLSCLRLEAPGYCRSLKGALTPALILRRCSALLHPTAFPEGCTQAMQAAPEGRSWMHGDFSRTSAPRAAYPASSIMTPRPSCHPLKGIHPTPYHLPAAERLHPPTAVPEEDCLMAWTAVSVQDGNFVSMEPPASSRHQAGDVMEVYSR